MKKSLFDIMQGVPTGAGRTQLPEGTVIEISKERDELDDSSDDDVEDDEEEDDLKEEKVQYKGIGSDPDEAFLLKIKTPGGNDMESEIEVSFKDLPESVKQKLIAAGGNETVSVNLDNDKEARQWANSVNDNVMENSIYGMLQNTNNNANMERQQQFRQASAAPSIHSSETSGIQASHREEDNLVPSDTNLFVWKNHDGTYSVQGFSYGGLVSPLWDVNESDLPEKIKSELASAKDFSPVRIDLKENEDIRQWTEVQFVKAYNEGRLTGPMNVGEQESLFPSQEKIPSYDTGEEDNIKYAQEQAAEDALRTLRDGARRTFLGTEYSDRQIQLNTKQNNELEDLRMLPAKNGKYSVTAVIGGKRINGEISESDLQNINKARWEEWPSAIAKALNHPELVNPAVSNEAKEQTVKSVTGTAAYSSPESMSRPEVYVSHTESVSEKAAAMQSAASATYSDIQQQSEQQSRTRSEGLGM